MHTLCSYVIGLHTAVPEVNIEMSNITIPEPDPEVEICFTLSTGITEEVVINAETGAKSGATNQAIGIYTLISYHSGGHLRTIYAQIFSTLAAGSDYETTTLMLTFEPSGGGQRVCGTVPIINDQLGNEPDELFSVTITSISNPNIMIGPDVETCVSIIDADGMC